MPDGGQVARLLADRPMVHAGGTAVWRTEQGLYELLERRCAPGSRTLETGLGISTLVFAMRGADHTCVVLDDEEVTALRRYADGHGIDVSGVRFEVGPSAAVLPRLPADPLDLVLVDGGHGWPLPIIDWFYAARRLVVGGFVVLDDTWLESVRLGLVTYLERDPRWRRVERTMRWQAFQLCEAHEIGEDHSAQTFLRRSTSSRVAFALPRPARRGAAKVARRLRLL